METDIIQEQIKNSVPEIKNFLAKGIWSEIVDQVSRKNNFSTEQKNALENEVLFVLLGMDLMTNFRQNCQSSLSINEVVAKNISDEIYNKAFKEVEKFLPAEAEPLTASVPEIPPENLPMVEEGEVAHEVPHVEQPTAPAPEPKPAKPAPEPVVTKEQQPPVQSDTTVTPIVNTSYPGGKDPYREPIEP